MKSSNAQLMPMTIRLRIWLVGFSLALVLGTAACSGGATVVPANPGGGSTVNVTLTEFKIILDHEIIPTGLVRFVITNSGSIEHNLFLEQVDTIEQPLPDIQGNPAVIEGIQAGKAAYLDFDFPAGGETYQLGCHLPGHYEAGMVTFITTGE